MTACHKTYRVTSNFIPTCSECSTPYPAPGIVSVRGESSIAICRECHKKMSKSTACRSYKRFQLIHTHQPSRFQKSSSYMSAPPEVRNNILFYDVLKHTQLIFYVDTARADHGLPRKKVRTSNFDTHTLSQHQLTDLPPHRRKKI